MSDVKEMAARRVLQEVRLALCVPEGGSVVETANLVYNRSVNACNVYDVLDSLSNSEGVGEEFVMLKIKRAMVGFK